MSKRGPGHAECSGIRTIKFESWAICGWARAQTLQHSNTLQEDWSGPISDQRAVKLIPYACGTVINHCTPIHHLFTPSLYQPRIIFVPAPHLRINAPRQEAVDSEEGDRDTGLVPYKLPPRVPFRGGSFIPPDYSEVPDACIDPITTCVGGALNIQIYQVRFAPHHWISSM